MKKRLLAWILVLMLAVTLLPTAALAEDPATFGPCGVAGNESSVTWNLTQNNEDAVNPTYTLTISGIGAMKNFTVNSSNDDRPWSDFISSITKGVVTQGVTNVGDRTFYNCSNMTSVELADGIISITGGAFENCTSLTSLALPNSLEKFGGNAFKGCTGLTGELVIPDSVREIKNWAFMNCTSISSVSIGKNVESISASAFENCKSLKNVTFRGGTKNIGSNAFRATSLTSLTLPDGLETIGADAFYGIATLSGMLVIPESVTKIERQAFWTGRNNGNGLLSDISGIRVDSPEISIGNSAFRATGANYIDLTRVDELSSWGDWVLDENESCIIYAKSDSVLNEVKKSKHVTNYIYALTSGGIFAGDTTFRAAALAAPVKDGCKFAGWYKDADFNTPLGEDALAAGQTYYAKWTDSVDQIPGKDEGRQMAVDLGSAVYGDTPSATVLFDGADELKEVKSDHDYFDAAIHDMNVTITPKAGLQPGTYTDTLYVHTENGAVHFITVTLTVTPKPEEPQQEADAALSGILAAITGTNPFSDVPGGAYYNAAVRWAVKNGIASGTDAKHFSPDAACTRAQAVTFLWRAAGSPAPTLAENPFTDVKPSDYCYDAVLWAVETGIAKGTGAAAFSPDAPCTRGQIVTFLYRAAGSPAGYANSGYTDVPETSYCAAPVAWAVALRITSGTGTLTFSPDDLCTRAQIATFLYRANA